ncbi:hypothetical protein Adt_19786 [Abeliophyllum distichum]|uniref:Signal peptidase I n=1 Tax=Abeliophyllum distichum TaxID=126358 RepID=A0ABD1SU10_9LAMI
MLNCFFPSVFLVIIQTLTLIHSSISSSPSPSDLSPKFSELSESQPLPHRPTFLKGVLDAIVDKEKWALEDVRVSKLDVRKAKYGSMRRYEFRFRVRKNEIVLKLYDQVSEWKKLEGLMVNGTSNFESQVRGVGLKAVIDSFKIEGPFEMRVSGLDDQLSLLLPINTSHPGLKRLLVGEGISVEVKGAEEISLFHVSERHQPMYGAMAHKEKNKSEFIWPALCAALSPIRIRGSASVVAYRTRNPSARIETVFPSRDTVELLPENCYVWPNYNKPSSLFSSIGMKVALLEKFVQIFSSERAKPNAVLGSLKAKIRESSMFRFQLEVERNIRSNDTYWSTLAEWRTKPSVERSLFDVVARIEGDVLNPIVVKKVRPFIEVDSFSWSNLLSNLSFTKFPPALVPPEALTLDVKW